MPLEISFFFKIVLLKNIFFFKVMLFKNIIFFKIWRVVKILIRNLTHCRNFSPKSDFYLVLQVLTEWWFFLSTLIPTSFKEENQKSMYIIDLVARWTTESLHTSIRLSMCEEHHYDNTLFSQKLRTELWSIECSRSAVFLKKRLCENKTKRSLVRILSIFSNVFVWATRRRAMERSWNLHSIYQILAAGRYLPKSWHLSKLTMLNRKSNVKTCVAQNIP